MLIFYIISPVIFLSMVISAVKLIKKKKYLELVSLLMLFPFVLFFTASVFLGGSTFHDAQADYEAYQAGHYYLMSHGDYTEVSHQQYVLMLILEIIGLLSLPLTLLWEGIRKIIVTRKNSK